MTTATDELSEASGPTAEPPAEPAAATATPKRRRRWQPYALGGIVLLSLVLYGWGIGETGWGNTFYTAAIKSMSQNLTNFVFGAFDPAGVVTVDKPPMALWPQVFSVWIFGWHSWAVLLPQVLEGAAAVFLLHRTVRRWAGENVALLAALILALTPITVAINRDNNPDTMLTLLCVAAAYAFTRSVEKDIPARSATKWLLQAAFWVGCGFLTKSLAAWMIIPALALGYLFGRNTSWGRRLADLAAAAGVLLVSSFWWVALTVIWPNPKPYVGGSTDGSELSLIFGYNGLGRVFGENIGRGARTGSPPDGGPGGGSGGGGLNFGGQTGLGRLFGDSVGGQISWLLPLCLFVLIVVSALGVLKWRTRLPADHQQRANWVMWGSWIVVLSLVFSFQAGIFHSYYTTQLAPAIAVVAAAGLAMLWRHYREAKNPSEGQQNTASWLLFPAGIAITAAWAWVIISRDTSWNGWVRYVVALVAAVAVIGLIVAKLTQRQRSRGAQVAGVLGLVAVLLTPGVWSAVTAFGETTAFGAMPSAGPANAMFGGASDTNRGPASGRGGNGGEHLGNEDGRQRAGEFPGMPGDDEFSQQQIEDMLRRAGFGRTREQGLTADQQKILDYVTKNAGKAKIVLAVEGGALGAANYIINSNATIIGMGGFMGSDPAPSISQLTEWKKEGALAFVLAPAQTAQSGDNRSPGGSGTNGFGRGGTAAAERTKWVTQNCTPVPASAYGGSTTSTDTGGLPGLTGAEQLYSCAAS